jgi:hypothetical protein
MSDTHAPNPDRRRFLAAGAAVAASAGLATAARAQDAAPADAGQIIADWPETARTAAQEMIEKYGPPAESTPSLLVWYDNAPWKRTIVYKEEVDHDFPMPHKDVMEQFINYDVPEDSFDDLAHYDGSVIVERTKGEISARCDKEGANFLAINLAHDIIQGNKSVEEARQAYVEAIQQFMAGNTPDIMKGFTFEVTTEDVGDPDETTIG